MRLLRFLDSRRFRWPMAIVTCFAALFLLFLTQAESGAPLGLMVLAAVLAYDG